MAELNPYLRQRSRLKADAQRCVDKLAGRISPTPRTQPPPSDDVPPEPPIPPKPRRR